MSAKELLRKEALYFRASLSQKRRLEASLKAFDFLKEKLQGLSVLSFASTPYEINLWPLNELLIEEKNLFLPKVTGSFLTIHPVQSLASLKASSLQILEPTSPPIAFFDLDLILVPGVAFDRQHHRIGYGKGYFDRLLSSLPSIPKWGIGFKETLYDSLPIEPHDVPLDAVFLF